MPSSWEPRAVEELSGEGDPWKSSKAEEKGG